MSEFCLLCGKRASHTHKGGYSLCNDCCATWGGLSVTDCDAHKWVEHSVLPRIAAVTAERDQMRNALENLLLIDGESALFSEYSAARAKARAALCGEETSRG